MPRHDFTIVSYKEDLSFEDFKISDAVTVDDSTILYAADTMHWFEAGWNSINNKQIGKDQFGNQVSKVKVVINPDGLVITAYPY